MITLEGAQSLALLVRGFLYRQLRHQSHPFSPPRSPFGFDLHDTLGARGIVPKTAPRPIFRMLSASV